jgi:hypothetical protein
MKGQSFGDPFGLPLVFFVQLSAWFVWRRIVPANKIVYF